MSAPPNQRLHRTRRGRSRSVGKVPLRRAGEPVVGQTVTGRGFPNGQESSAELSTIHSKSFDVFLSYNRADRAHARVLASVLRERLLAVWFDEWELVPGKPWQEALESAILGSRSVAVLVGRSGVGPWQQRELRASLEEFVAKELPVIPVLLPGAPRQPSLPLFLRAFTWIDLRRGVSGEELNRLQWGITGKSLGRGITARDVRARPRIAITHLPITQAELVGREEELKSIQRSWLSPRLRIACLVGWGGVGKSAIVNSWLRKMSKRNWRGVSAVFGWSFYSQGTANWSSASADQFIDSALRWFGDESPSSGTPWQRGERLADLMTTARTLLVLDGLEPLQHPLDGSHRAGRLRDPALTALLRSFATSSDGFCLITSREPVRDLEPFQSTSAREICVGGLSLQDSVCLLRRYAPTTPTSKLEELAGLLKGHCLTLELVGRYIQRACGGVVPGKAIDLMTIDRRQGDQAHSVLAMYERWFESGPEIEILRLLGLFDRPASMDLLRFVARRPIVDGLVERLVGMDGEQWNTALSNLQECGLVLRENRGTHVVDCHPLIREYFSERLAADSPAAFREGHRRIYLHLSRVATRRPDTLQDMLPLYAAIRHGCAAGLQRSVFVTVLRKRIQRDDAFFSVHVLGAFGAELAALASFFEEPWTTPSPKLPMRSRAELLRSVGFHLLALGRPGEAADASLAAQRTFVSLGDWREACGTARNRSEALLNFGKIPEAILAAKESRKWGLQSQQRFMEQVATLALAEALHQGGHFKEAESAYRETLSVPSQDDPQYPVIQALAAFGWCDFLLGRTEAKLTAATLRTASERSGRQPRTATAGVTGKGEMDRVRKAAQLSFRPVLMLDRPPLIAVPLLNLILGRIATAESMTRRRQVHSAVRSLNEAVDGLREAGTVHHLVKALLARSRMHRLAGDLKSSGDDLAETRRICEQTELRLLAVDALLEGAWQALANSRARTARSKRLARELIAEGRSAVESHGYYRRSTDLRVLEAMLA